MVNGNFSSTLRQLLAEYDGRINRAKTELQRLEDLRNAAMILLENETLGESKDKPAPTSDMPYSSISVTEGAEMILRKHGNQVMHVNDILKNLLKGGWNSNAKNPKLTVSGTLFRAKQFEKMGGNKFRLVDVIQMRLEG